MTENSVDRFYEDIDRLLSILSNCGEISLRSSTDDTCRKSLLLSIASHFEVVLSNAVLEFVQSQTRADHIIVSLVKSKAISRQYHTWFNWESNNANAFFALFGEEFSKSAKAELSKRADLELAIKDFIELGRDRNRLVHRDFANFPLEKTSEEIYTCYRSAQIFVEWVSQALDKFSTPERKLS